MNHRTREQSRESNLGNNDCNANCNSANGTDRDENVDSTNPLALSDAVNGSCCMYSLQIPCVVLTGPPRPRGQPSPINHTRRLKEYRYYYSLLNKLKLWKHEEYLSRKQELGCHINDVREVMPLCFVGNVRSRWPNLPQIPNMGHKRA